MDFLFLFWFKSLSLNFHPTKHSAILEPLNMSINVSELQRNASMEFPGFTKKRWNLRSLLIRSTLKRKHVLLLALLLFWFFLLIILKFIAFWVRDFSILSTARLKLKTSAAVIAITAAKRDYIIKSWLHRSAVNVCNRGKGEKNVYNFLSFQLLSAIVPLSLS